MPKPDVLVLAYKNCDTCKKALRWLDAKGVAHAVRPIVEEPPTPTELAKWIPASRVLGFGLWALGFGLWALGFGLWGTARLSLG